MNPSTSARGTFHTEWHRPRFHRYRVADPGLKLARNRYASTWIGLDVVIGRHAYGVKWASARFRSQQH